MNSQRKSFDLGLYSYRPTVHGAICPKDERKLTIGQVVAVLHPMRTADPRGLYCFGVTHHDGTLTMMRKNLKFNRTITLSYEREPLSTATMELHAMLNKVQLYLQQQEGTQALLIINP